MDEIKVIDNVLSFLKDFNPNSAIRELELFHSIGMTGFIEDRDKYIVLQKLKKEGYIDTINIPDNNISELVHVGYFITFDGLRFIKKGGYTKQYIQEKAAANRQKIQMWVILTISILTFLLTVAKALIPYVRNYYPHFLK
ncbi:MAG: hypothetical protein WCL06_06745 [Bacteroidota bacterium]